MKDKKIKYDKLMNKIDGKFGKLEDWFLNLSFVKNKPLEDKYFTLCRIKIKLKDFLWNDPKNFIVNTWKYRKILKDDRWFDHYHLMSLLKHKLKNDAKYYRLYGVSIESDKCASQMEECVKLLNVMIKDEYDEHVIDNVRKKYGMKTIDELLKEDINFSINEKEILLEDQKKEYSKNIRKGYEEANNRRQHDTKRLFKIMSDNIWSWWD